LLTATCIASSTMFPVSAQTLGTTRTVAQWNLILAYLQHSKAMEKHANKKLFGLNVCFVRILRLYIYYINHKVCIIHWKLHLLSPKIIMLTKTNICSAQNYLRGNTDRQQFENEKQSRRFPLWKKFCGRSCFLTFVFCYFRAFTHYALFVSFCSLNFGCKISRINPLLVIISSKLPAITNIIHKLLWALQTIPNDN